METYIRTSYVCFNYVPLFFLSINMETQKKNELASKLNELVSLSLSFELSNSILAGIEFKLIFFSFHVCEKDDDYQTQ